MRTNGLTQVEFAPIADTVNCLDYILRQHAGP
jgi:hypothetical protein